MIDAQTCAYIFSSLMGTWMLGFLMGKGVAYVRALRDVA